MKHYMLDTNTVSDIIKLDTNVVQHLVNVPLASLCISAITEGELLLGLAKRPNAKRLYKAVREFLLRVDVLPWNSAVTERYGQVRDNLERHGKVLGALDMLICCTCDGSWSYPYYKR